MANETQQAKILLSLFTNDQIAAIYRTVRSSSLESLALSDRERVSDNMPPAILGFLTRGGYLNEQDTKELAWGFATMLYGSLNTPKDANWWSNIYQTAFGLSGTYADNIAARIETDDKIPGLMNQALDFLRRAYNFVVPEGIEITQADKFDVDGMWEMQLAGRQTIDLSKRAYSGLAGVRASVLQGTVFDMLTRAESGDLEEGDVEIGDYAQFAHHVVRAKNAATLGAMPEQGLVGPLLGLGAKLIAQTSLGNKAQSFLTRGLGKAATLASRMLTNNKLTSLRSADGFGGSLATPNELKAAPFGTGVGQPPLPPAMQQYAQAFIPGGADGSGASGDDDSEYDWES